MIKARDDHMKTLVLVSHPQLKDSYTQSFLKKAQTDFSSVTWHPLDLLYPDGQIQVQKEQKLLMENQRIIFQFPLFWYSSPALLKKWEDEVLVEHFANTNSLGYLRNKELGLVITLGQPHREYQAGGSEHFSLSQLLTPFQALSMRTGMRYLKPFIISQFFYETPRQEARTLIDYQNYLTNVKPDGFHNRLAWLLQQLKKSAPQDKKQRLIYNSMLQSIQDNQNQLDDLKRQLKLIKRKDE